jgi:hypothetical protein
MNILKNTSIILVFVAVIGVSASFLPNVSHAAVNVGGVNPPAGEVNVGGVPPPSSSGQTIVNPLKVSSLEEFINLILKAVVQIGTIVLTLAIIWVGFLFVAARGNAEKISSARSALMWTIIGGLILLGAQAIGLVIKSTVNGL